MKKKIVFAVHSLCPGGQERVMSVLVNEFHKYQDAEVHLIVFGRDPEFFYELNENTIIHKPDIEYNEKYRSFYTLKVMAYVRSEISKLKPAAVLSFGEYWNNFVLLSCFGAGAPVFVSDRNQPDKKLKRSQEYLRKFLYRTAKGIVAQTGIARKLLFDKTSHNNITIIGNPINKFSTAIPQKRENIVLTVGRLISTKHHDELIRLFEKVRFADWKLVIVGDDAIKQQNRAKLESIIKDLSLEDHVILTGSQSNVDVFYARAKIFAFTSSSEGFPNVIGEAMSAALPVVAFDCVAGPSEMIEDNKTGFLIPLFDYSLFGEKLSLLMRDDKLVEQMGNEGKAKIRQFESSIIARKFYNFMLK